MFEFLSVFSKRVSQNLLNFHTHCDSLRNRQTVSSIKVNFSDIFNLEKVEKSVLAGEFGFFFSLLIQNRKFKELFICFLKIRFSIESWVIFSKKREYHFKMCLLTFFDFFEIEKFSKNSFWVWYHDHKMCATPLWAISQRVTVYGRCHNFHYGIILKRFSDHLMLSLYQRWQGVSETN